MVVKTKIDVSGVKLDMRRKSKKLYRIQMAVKAGTYHAVQELKKLTPKSEHGGDLAKGWTYRTRKLKDGFEVKIMHDNPKLLDFLEFGTTGDGRIYPSSKQALTPVCGGYEFVRAWVRKGRIKPRGFIRKAMDQLENSLNSVFEPLGLTVDIKINRPLA